MMYNNKMVAVIKVGGKILREVGEVVYIPFGSEYEISLKNLHTTRAAVTISIDGEDVLDGCRLVVNPDETSRIEGFMRDNAVSHKFKFIEKTQEISEYRGDKISDGLIRIGFCFEQQVSWMNTVHPTYYRKSYEPVYGSSSPDFASNQLVGGFSNNSLSSERSLDYQASQVFTNQVLVSDAGITVKGSESNQQFSSTKLGIMETTKYSMVIQLKGQVGSDIIAEPVFVKTKLKCDTCGRSSSTNAKFCGNCGTSLVI